MRGQGTVVDEQHALQMNTQKTHYSALHSTMLAKPKWHSEGITTLLNKWRQLGGLCFSQTASAQLWTHSFHRFIVTDFVAFIFDRETVKCRIVVNSIFPWDHKLNCCHRSHIEIYMFCSRGLETSTFRLQQMIISSTVSLLQNTILTLRWLSPLNTMILQPFSLFLSWVQSDTQSVTSCCHSWAPWVGFNS